VPLRVVFFGTPEFAVPSYLALTRSSHAPIAAVTQPDRARGRGLIVTPGPVKLAAQSSVPVLQPDRLKDDSWLSTFRDLQPDLAVVAAYGKLLPQALLDIPRLGVINVHASLLPRWRGAAPVHRAILAGDAETGVTIMKVVLALDAGPMLDRVVTAIDPDETSQQLEGRLAELGAALLVDVVDRIATDRTPREVAQDDTQATYAPRLDRSDSPIDWARPASVVHNQIRGLHPWPLASTTSRGRRLLVRQSMVGSRNEQNAVPGTVISATHDELLIAAQPGSVGIIEIQPEGRRAMAVKDFLNGTRLTIGDRFL